MRGFWNGGGIDPRKKQIETIHSCRDFGSGILPGGEVKKIRHVLSIGDGAAIATCHYYHSRDGGILNGSWFRQDDSSRAGFHSRRLHPCKDYSEEFGSGKAAVTTPAPICKPVRLLDNFPR
jgi:hypothetical protein